MKNNCLYFFKFLIVVYLVTATIAGHPLLTCTEAATHAPMIFASAAAESFVETSLVTWLLDYLMFAATKNNLELGMVKLQVKTF